MYFSIYFDIFDLLIDNFDLLIHNFDLLIHNFDLLINNLDLLIVSFDFLIDLHPSFHQKERKKQLILIKSRSNLYRNRDRRYDFVAGIRIAVEFGRLEIRIVNDSICRP